MPGRTAAPSRMCSSTRRIDRYFLSGRIEWNFIFLKTSHSTQTDSHGLLGYDSLPPSRLVRPCPSGDPWNPQEVKGKGKGAHVEIRNNRQQSGRLRMSTKRRICRPRQHVTTTGSNKPAATVNRRVVGSSPTRGARHHSNRRGACVGLYAFTGFSGVPAIKAVQFGGDACVSEPPPAGARLESPGPDRFGT